MQSESTIIKKNHNKLCYFQYRVLTVKVKVCTLVRLNITVASMNMLEVSLNNALVNC